MLVDQIKVGLTYTSGHGRESMDETRLSLRRCVSLLQKVVSQNHLAQGTHAILLYLTNVHCPSSGKKMSMGWRQLVCGGDMVDSVGGGVWWQ